MLLEEALKLGLIVNPVAGLGGPLGLKGTDGALAEIARQRTQSVHAATRATRALAALKVGQRNFDLYAAGGAMGVDAAEAEGLTAKTVYRPVQPTGPDDSIEAARRMLGERVDLLLFSGGDGTARDIMRAVGDACPVLGIPAGVKMHSAVFARTPGEAGQIAAALVEQQAEKREYAPADVVDRDDDGIPHLFGTMRVPADPRRMQPAKASFGGRGELRLRGACEKLASQARKHPLTIIGPGSTTLMLKQLLEGGATLLGVDVYAYGRCIAQDADERRILNSAKATDSGLLIHGVIGGQGFLIGRGNQQISPEVIRRIGQQNIIGLASIEKIATLPDHSLFADTGDDGLDRELAGYVRVQVSAANQILMPLNARLSRQSNGKQMT